MFKTKILIYKTRLGKVIFDINLNISLRILIKVRTHLFSTSKVHTFIIIILYQ